MENRNPKVKAGRSWVVMFCGLALALAVLIASITTEAQSFSSGSDGSDGALTVAANQGTIVFDPLDTARWGRVLDPDGDGVYNFTTITINSGSLLRFQGDKVGKPLYWLASGNVVINGTLELSGAPGTVAQDLNYRRQVAIPGSGGYAGGAGGVGTLLPTPGEGPGGGSGGGVSCGGTVCASGKGGTFTGNRYLIPLVGGSGGEGAFASNGYTGGNYLGGGAGAGAILVASSTSIALGGGISANGGNGAPYNTYGGGGSGGAIRLVAPALSGSGFLNVGGGSGAGGVGNGSNGWVRLEGFVISSSFTLNAGETFATRGSPVDSSSLRPPSSIRVTAIDGISVPASPSGSFVLPDVTISKVTPVNVDIQATGIPSGTVVTLQIYPQTPTDLTTVNLPSAQATLAGTLQSSTATATFTFPYGFSRGFVRASWTQ